MAHQQIPEPDSRRRGSADPSPERLQDQQPDAAGPDQPRGSGEPVPRLRLDAILRGGSDPESMHQAMAATLEHCVSEIRKVPAGMPRLPGLPRGPRWPMIVLRTPKGLGRAGGSGGHRLEGFWRAHQVPLADVRRTRSNSNPRELDARAKTGGTVRCEWQADSGTQRAGANRHPPDERQSARERRTSQEAVATCRISGTTA